MSDPLRSAIGDADPMEWLRSLDSTVVRDKPGRLTFQFEHAGRLYYAKLHGGPGLREALKDLLSWRTPPLDAGREARALERLQGLGVSVPKLVAWGVRGPWLLSRSSFLVTEDVGTQETAGDVLQALPAADHGSRRALVRCIAQLARRLHQAGVNHRDLYLGHILIPDREGALDPVLIDLHRAQVWGAIPRRWVAKDLGCLAFDALGTAITRTDRMRFVSEYAGDGKTAAAALREDPKLWRKASQRAHKLAAERARKGSAFGG